MFTNSHGFGSVGWLLAVILNCYCVTFVSAHITIHPLNRHAFVGENATFDCFSYLGIPPDTWLWYKENDGIIARDFFVTRPNKYEVTYDYLGSKLTILNTTLEDNQTQYHCESRYFGDISHTANLIIIQGLEVTYPQCNINVTAANTKNAITLTCNARGGDPRPSLQWYRNYTAMQHKTIVNLDDESYYVEYQYSVIPKDEDNVFVCKAEWVDVEENHSCSVRLNIIPTVILSADSIVFYENASVTITCAAETPWTIAGYQWSINRQPETPSELKSYFEDDGRVLVVSGLKQNHTGIEIGCNVTTTTGLVGSDVISLKYIDKRCRPRYKNTEKEYKNVNLITVICLSLAMVGAFFVGRILNSNNVAKLKKSICTKFNGSADSDSGNTAHSNKIMNPTSDEPVYQNSVFKISTAKIQVITEETSYATLNPTACSTYAELNPGPN